MLSAKNIRSDFFDKYIAIGSEWLRVIKLQFIESWKMKKEDEGGEKKSLKPNAKDNQRWIPYVGNKPFKSTLKALKDNVFEMGSVKNATQFLRSLLNIADYVQMKYNNKAGDAIRNLKYPMFVYPNMLNTFEGDKGFGWD